MFEDTIKHLANLFLAEAVEDTKSARPKDVKNKVKNAPVLASQRRGSSSSPGKKDKLGVADFASRDIVLSSWAWALEERGSGNSKYYIRFFISSDAQGFEYDASVRGGITLILCQAYAFLRKMEVCFDYKASEQAFEPMIPASTYNYCAKYGIVPRYPNRITAEEGRTLFIRMNLAPKEVERIEGLELDPHILALQKMRGTWSAGELWYLFTYLSHPEMVLDGRLLDSGRLFGLPFESQRFGLIKAIFADRLVNCLGILVDNYFGEHEEGYLAFPFKWETSDSVIMTPRLDISLDCQPDSSFTFKAGHAVRVILAPRQNREYRAHLEYLSSLVGQFEDELPVLLAVTSDFDYVDDRSGEVAIDAVPRGTADSTSAKYHSFLRATGWLLYQVPLAAGELDTAFFQKLRRASNFNAEAAEQPEG